jgi:hypothetical protein
VSRIFDGSILPVEKLWWLSEQNIPWVLAQNIVCSRIGKRIGPGSLPANAMVGAVENQEVFENFG